MPDEPGDIPTPPTDEVGQPISTESSLSNWAGDYVTDMLGRGWAQADAPYEAYSGPLTAGSSDLQNQAFGGIAGLTLPDEYGQASGMASDIYDNAGAAGQYDPSNMSTGMWNNQQAQQYMSPYVQQALNPQLDEMRRQAEIQRQVEQGQMTQAGAYGGSRSALLNSEMDDNMLRLMSELTGKGYQDAYESAGKMFTSDYQRDLDSQKANEQSRQFGAGLGLEALQKQLSAAGLMNKTGNDTLNAQRDIYGDQLDAGGIERGITSEGINADRAQFEQERDFPYQQVQYMHSLLGGMPLATQNYSYGQPSTFADMVSGGAGLQELYDSIFGTTGGGPDIDNGPNPDASDNPDYGDTPNGQNA